MLNDRLPVDTLASLARVTTDQAVSLVTDSCKRLRDAMQHVGFAAGHVFGCCSLELPRVL
jgi:hypothetical protein